MPPVLFMIAILCGLTLFGAPQRTPPSAPAAGSAASCPDGSDARHDREFAPRRGALRLAGRAILDDDGEFVALGATNMWAAWGFRHDRERLEANLRFIAEHCFDYVRALGVVGRQPYWAGREIDWRWEDYPEVIAGLTDLAYDHYGLRVQWTIFADADQMIPDRDDRFRLVDRFLEMSRGREHKILFFEMANESWQNGFGGAEGIALIRALTGHLRERTDIPVAISDSLGHDCADHLALYRGGIADIITEHFHREIRGPAGRWRPVWQPWELAACPGLPGVASNNEPIGPESSVAQDDDPVRLVAAAIATYMAQIPFYVFHSDAGVRGHRHLWEMANARATFAGYRAMKDYLPADIVSWDRFEHDEPGHPFMVYAGGRPNALWLDGFHSGAVRVFASRSGSRFIVLPIGVRDVLEMRATGEMRVETIDPLTGAVEARHELGLGDTMRLEGRAAFVLRGEFVPRTADDMGHAARPGAAR